MHFVMWESLHPGMGASNTTDASAVKSVWMTSTELNISGRLPEIK